MKKKKYSFSCVVSSSQEKEINFLIGNLIFGEEMTWEEKHSLKIIVYFEPIFDFLVLNLYLLKNNFPI